MRTYDVAPLFRSSIGFDRLFELLNQPERVETTAAWPPYNIEKVADDHIGSPWRLRASRPTRSS